MVKRTIKNELIGSTITIVKSTNKNDIGLSGVIIDETKNTIKISHGEKEKVLIKQNITIKIGQKSITGEEMMGRPEERLKGK